MSPPALVVVAKEPVPGRVKTRLSPPWTPREAAAVAEAALADTLATVAATPAPTRILALDGMPGPWLPDGFEVINQVDGGLDRRLAAAFDAVGGPALLIGMDTPQVTPRVLEASLRRLADDDTDAVLGPANDGGYWAIGLQQPDPRVFLGVPMSAAWTAREQRRRFAQLGLRWHELERMRDVDTVADAHAVARLRPRSRFETAIAALVQRNPERAHAAVAGDGLP